MSRQVIRTFTHLLSPSAGPKKSLQKWQQVGTEAEVFYLLMTVKFGIQITVVRGNIRVDRRQRGCFVHQDGEPEIERTTLSSILAC